MTLDLQRWSRLYLDQPEDRLFHASDQTWWQRIDGTYLGTGALYKAAEPQYVQDLRARILKLEAKVLKYETKVKRPKRKIRMG